MAVIARNRKASSHRSPVAAVAILIGILVLLTVFFNDMNGSTDSILGEAGSSSYDLLTTMSGLSTSNSNPTNATSTRNWIWEELNPREQTLAMKDARPYLEAFVSILNKTKQDKWVSQERCEVQLFGSQWGTHQLCKRSAPPINCHFISFGISVDYSFDTELAEQWQCHGFAADPTIVHKSQLHDLVTFHNIAAKTLKDNQEARDAKRPWWVASVPSVKRFLGLKHIDVLKMDCEGCEYSIARDILVEEPDFFHHVDQFTFEVHLNEHWLNDIESFYYMALLYKLLHEAGLEVMGTSIGGCGSEVEKYGSMKELVELGYPNAGAKKLYGRRSCHEYLFARVDKL